MTIDCIRICINVLYIQMAYLIFVNLTKLRLEHNAIFIRQM